MEVRGPRTQTKYSSSQPELPKNFSSPPLEVLTVKPNAALRIHTKLGPTKLDNFTIIDTGSAVSLLGFELATQIPNLNWNLPYSGPSISIANGNLLHILGVATLEVLIGSCTYFIPFIVVDDFPFGCLLGNDFLETRVKLDLIKGKFIIDKEVVDFVREICKRSALVIAKDVDIEPQSLMFVECNGISSLNSSSLIIYEPIDGLHAKHSIWGVRSIFSSSSGLRIPLLNPYAKPVHLKSQTVIGSAELQELHSCFISEVSDNSETAFENTNTTTYNSFISKVSSSTLDKSQAKLLHELLWKYRTLFSGFHTKPGKTNLISHKIITENSKPIKSIPRRFSPVETAAEKAEVSKMLKDGVIEHSDSPWSSPVVLVRKKDSTLRFCVDYRKLNSVTKKDVYPIPRIDDTLDSLAGSHIFSALDLAAGYWQIPLENDSKEKTAFVTKDGLFHFNVLPFGLTNAPATFQRLMDSVLRHLKWQFCLVYMDDVIIYSKSFDEHLKHLQSVFHALHNANLLLKLEKCKFGLSSIPYLGHIISKDGIQPNPKNVEAIVKFPIPKNVEEIRRFLGLANHYRKFVHNFSMIAFPLSSLYQGNTPFVWSADCQIAFDTLKKFLSSSPILSYPDFTLPFKLTGDASLIGIGSILSQIQNGKEVVIGYASRTLSRAERNYSTTERECLAIVHGCRIFRPYLYGNKVDITTDHAALQWLFNQKDPPARLHRWILKLTDLDLDVKYSSGKSIQHVDALSRAPIAPVSDVFPTLVTQTIRSVPLELFKEAQLKDKSLDIFRLKCDKKQEVEGESFVIDNDLLYRIKKVKRITNITTLKQLVVPNKFKNDILTMCHDNLLSGHLGITATYLRMIQRFWWKGMKSDTEAWVKSCPDCESRKTPKGIHKIGKLMSIPVVPEPFYTIGVDIMGPFTSTESPRNNRYIIVFTCYFTKWAEAFPLQSQDAESIAKVLVEQIICRHGIPKRIISDRGKAFIGKIMTYVYELLGIEKFTTTAYHPQTDGLTERLNQTIVNILTKYVSSSHKDWDLYLPYALHAYRTAVHSSTKFSPYFLLYGRESKTPLDIALSDNQPVPPKSASEYIKDLHIKFKLAFDVALHNIEIAQSRQTLNYDKNKITVNYNIGDKVRIWIPSSKKGQTPKLLCNWFGPYEIIQKLTPVTYRVKTIGSKSIHGVIHVSRMKPFRDPLTPLPSSKYTIPDPDDDIIDPNVEEPDFNNAELPFPYEKLDDASTIIEDDVTPPKGEDENIINLKNTQTTNNNSTKQKDSVVEIDENTEFPLPVKDSRKDKSNFNNTDIKDQQEIIAKKIEKKNGKSKTFYLVKWKSKSEPTWHPREGLLIKLVKEFNAKNKQK